MIYLKYLLIYVSTLFAWGGLLSFIKSASDSLRSQGEMLGQPLTSGDLSAVFIVFAISAFMGQFLVGAAAAKHRKSSSPLFNPIRPLDYLVLFIGIFLSGFALFIILFFAVFIFLWIARGIRFSDLNRR